MNHESTQKAILGPLKYQFPNFQPRMVVIAYLIRLLSLFGRFVRPAIDRGLVFHSAYRPPEWEAMLTDQGVL